MRRFTAFPSGRRGSEKYLLPTFLLLVCVFGAGLLIGRYPMSPRELLRGSELQRQIFLVLRLPRGIVGAAGGFVLGVSGYVYETVLRNPLASPDVIGVSAGASAGAAAGILFFAGSWAVTAFAFLGAVLAAGTALALAAGDRSAGSGTVVLAGIAVNALAQTVLTFLKLTADPEKELASIEYWIMGSLNGITPEKLPLNLAGMLLCAGALFVLFRHILILIPEEGEAAALGAEVGKLRLLLLLLATAAVSCVVSLTGLVSFVGLLSPHIAERLLRRKCPAGMLLSGLVGGILLTLADIPARCLGPGELPVSLFTSLLGAPFLLRLLRRGRKRT